MRPFRPLPALLALPLLGACATQGSFPSLAPRAVERDLTGAAAPADCPDFPEVAAETTPPAPLPVNPDPGLGARAAELLAAARAGQAEFAAALAPAREAAASAGGVGTESWIAAQQQISRLDAARARTVDALAELESLAIDRSGVAVELDDYEAVLEAAEEVRALVQAQQADLDAITTRVSAP